MSENDDCLQSLSSGEFDGDEDQGITYATLMPLRPLSPLSANDRPSGYGCFQSQTCLCTISNGFSLKYEKDIDSTLRGYEFLEPLLPVALLDGSGNVECCEVQPQLSLYHRTSLLLPLTKDLDTSTSDESLNSNSIASNISTRAINNQPYVDSIQSSRSSTPEVLHESNNSFTAGKGPSDPTLPGTCIASHTSSDTFELDVDMEYVDTRDIAEKVSTELKKYNISQVAFAQTILGRSQGTLSDLLRNPKPWAKLKSGRETFCRMWKWLQEPESERMAPFKVAGVKSESPKAKPVSSSLEPKEASKTILTTKSQPAAVVNQSKSPSQSEIDLKKRRNVFTDEQRASLRNIFRKMPRPSRELQLSIARQLGLPTRTVSNFFMNARRRPRVKWQDDIHRFSGIDDDSGTNSGSDMVS